MPGAAARRAWSRCGKCGQCKYNDVLVGQMCLCMKCEATVQLYKAPRNRAVHFADHASATQ
eukprot:501331-Pyramimonas_sp.AAC.1